MSYADALVKIGSKSIGGDGTQWEDIVSAGCIARVRGGRLPKRVMLTGLVGGKGRQAYRRAE